TPPIDTSNVISENPRMTSGITSGAVISALKADLPRKRRNRVITIAAMVPSTVAAQAVQNATFRLIHNASINARSLNSSPYQRVENPAHTVASRELLNENSTSSRIGRYRNAKPSASEHH